MSVKFLIFSYSSVLAYVLGDQKNRLNETVLLSPHNICFGWKIRFVFDNAFTKAPDDLKFNFRSEYTIVIIVFVYIHRSS